MTIIAEAKDLKAHYITQAFGVERVVRAVDGISVQIEEGKVFGIAGESVAIPVEVALPLLQQRGMVAEFFITSDFIGQPGMVSADDVRRLEGPEIEKLYKVREAYGVSGRAYKCAEEQCGCDSEPESGADGLDKVIDETLRVLGRG